MCGCQESNERSLSCQDYTLYTTLRRHSCQGDEKCECISEDVHIVVAGFEEYLACRSVLCVRMCIGHCCLLEESSVEVVW